MSPTFSARSKAAQPIWFVTQANFSKVTDKLDKRTRAFVKASGFEPSPGRHLLLPGSDGTGGALFGIEAEKAANKGAFRFTRYRKAKDKAVKLVLPDGVDGEELSRIAEGVMLARDLINTPANDM